MNKAHSKDTDNRIAVDMNKAYSKDTDNKITASKNSNAVFLCFLPVPFCILLKYVSSDAKA